MIDIVAQLVLHDLYYIFDPRVRLEFRIDCELWWKFRPDCGFDALLRLTETPYINN